ncbi:hypothetical protein RHGRI_037345 [Rhododendron griersonianum]|uniref:Gnk2-homologous domain-containing protein n=1 Tax=Rhododendron griersonianum TaxID=479676 RepID=A0AAV6HVN5_9ERIC|nr:hypothetical protein RHGRI_037345 [Rhododendron griersonianum]
MISSSSNLSSALLISFLLTVLHFLSLSPTSKATPTYSAILCPNISTYSPNSTYQSSLKYLLSALSSAAPDGFFNFTARPPDPSYGLFLCRGDLSSTACDDCVAAASTEVLRRCPQSKSATIWYDECMLRYSDTSIFSTMDITHNVMLAGNDEITTLRSLQYDLSTIRAVTNNFSDDNKIGMGGFGPVYKAWRLWKDGTPLDLMDPALEGSYSRNEVHRCIHIGLLCAQPDPDARPSMAKVVRMLSRYSTMSLPQQPAFFARSRTTSSTLQGLEPDWPMDKPMMLPVNEESIAELDRRQHEKLRPI